MQAASEELSAHGIMYDQQFSKPTDGNGGYCNRAALDPEARGKSMIAYHEVPGTNLVELTIDGKIGEDEFDEVLSTFEASIGTHGKIRLLEHIHDFGGMPPSKYWDDLKFGFKHLGDISHAAIVAHETWVEALTKIANPFTSAEVRDFDSAELDEARRWLDSAA